MKLQYQLSNGTWTDCNERTEEFLSNAVNMKQDSRDGWVAITRDEATDRLNRGGELRHGTNWYQCIRDGEAVERIAAERRAATVRDYPDGLKLACGHTVYSKISVMSSSRGTCCAECYDDMSN